MTASTTPPAVNTSTVRKPSGSARRSAGRAPDRAGVARRRPAARSPARVPAAEQAYGQAATRQRGANRPTASEPAVAASAERHHAGQVRSAAIEVRRAWSRPPAAAAPSSGQVLAARRSRPRPAATSSSGGFSGIGATARRRAPPARQGLSNRRPAGSRPRSPRRSRRTRRPRGRRPRGSVWTGRRRRWVWRSSGRASRRWITCAWTPPSSAASRSAAAGASASRPQQAVDRQVRNHRTARRARPRAGSARAHRRACPARLKWSVFFLRRRRLRGWGRRSR